MDEQKKKAIELAIKQIDKTFGKGALVRLGDKEIEPIDSISTGSLGLDIALGIGGVPKGRIIEIYGPESSGKNNTCTSDNSRSTKTRRYMCFCRC